MAARRGRFDSLEARAACIGPTNPLLLPCLVQGIRWCAVVAVVIVIEHAAADPWNISPVYRRQRRPKFVVKKHAAIATTAAGHFVAPQRPPTNRTDGVDCVAGQVFSRSIRLNCPVLGFQRRCVVPDSF